ncbi:lipase family protein [Nocardia sp. NPDC051570]|uniref:lipase family protein n=1 Tax=Nocardia sp. NPDC051570 TaxID=3364324 RepID=UPI0037AB3FB3
MRTPQVSSAPCSTRNSTTTVPASAQTSISTTPLSDQRVVRGLDINSLGQRIPYTPIFEFNSRSDELTPVTQVDAILDTYCAAGVPVDRVRAPGGHPHRRGPRAGPRRRLPPDRFASKPAPSNCP